MKRFLPWIILAVAAACIAANWLPPKTAKDDFDFSRFGEIPVLVGGRMKPLDTVARNSLLIIHGKQELRLEGGRRLSAIQWLADVLLNAPAADQYPVFIVQNADVLGLFGWQQSDRKYFSFAEFAPFLKQVDEQAAQSDKLEAVQRSAYQSAILNLRNSLSLYQRLKNSIQPEGAQDFAAELHRFESTVPGAATAAHEREMGENFDKAKLDDVAAMIQRYERLSEMAYLLSVPPLGQNDQWHSAGDSLLRSVGTGEIHPVVTEYAVIGDAYRADDQPLFNQHVRVVADWFAKEQPKTSKRASFEFLFNRLQPFSQSMTLYVLAFLLACASWLGASSVLRRSAFYILLLALAIHTFGLFSRMYLQERPPVTNLYSSAIFIGWGAVIVALILERIFRDGIGAACAGAIGFVTLIIAHHLAGSGDTLEMLQAVLDTNIWLATHVVAITTGYSAMFLAGMLAIIYVVRGVFTRSLKKQTARFTRAHDVRRRLFRDSVQFCRHSPRRYLGRSIVGPVLGLGPERKRRGADRPLVRNHFARALGRIHPATRSDDHGALRQHRDQFLVVRRQHARCRPAFLRLHAKGISMAGGIHDQPTGINGRCFHAPRKMA